MSSLASSVTSTHTYCGSSEVNFFLNDHEELTVTIDTDRLHIRSVEASEKDYSSYAALFGDEDVMGKYATRQMAISCEEKGAISSKISTDSEERNPKLRLLGYRYHSSNRCEMV